MTTVPQTFYRPWGQFRWLLGQMPRQPWHFIGALSTEDRCLSVLRHNQDTLDIDSALLFEIVDEASEFSDRAKLRRDANRTRLGGLVSSSMCDVHQMGLFDPIVSLKQKIGSRESQSPSNVILDVSALPKRVFFPTIRWLLANPAIDNLLLTYMKPERYTTEALAYNAREWAQLPTFVSSNLPPDPPVARLVVGVGFLPFGLPELLKHHYHDLRAKISLVLPFPSHPAAVHRAWEFIRQIDAETRLDSAEQIQRVSADDLVGCFDRLNRITQNGLQKTVFAPYGPKPHSVAMCLHAISTASEVYYTQPAYYHPDYTTGIQLDEVSKPAGLAYLVKWEGQNLYSPFVS